MTIELSKLTDLQLLSLISEATAELTARAGKPVVERFAAAEREKITVREPATEQKDFALMIKAKLMRGDYIKAGERQDVAAITAEFPEWSRMQRLPLTSNAGDWGRASESATTPRAKER